MKRSFGIFILTPAEQRVVIFVVVLLLAFAVFKRQRDLKHESASRAPSLHSPSP